MTEPPPAFPECPAGAEPPALSVVIPAYNEEARVGATVGVVMDYLQRRAISFEVLVVDDGSRDGTGERARKAGRGDPRLRVLRLDSNCGKGAAVRAGVLASRGAAVLFSDADLSTPIDDLERLEAALAGGAAVAFGSRALRGSRVEIRQPLYRQTMGKIFNKLVQVLALPGVRDTQCGFKLLRARAAREVFACQRIPGFAFDVEVLYLARRLGYRLAEVPVRWRNSPASRVDPLWDSLRMMRDLVRVRWNALRGRYPPRRRTVARS